MATAPPVIPRQAGFKPHRLTGQEIAHSKARRQAEIYTLKTRMAPPNSLQVWREGDKKKKIPRKSSLLKWQPNRRGPRLDHQHCSEICRRCPSHREVCFCKDKQLKVHFHVSVAVSTWFART